MAGRHDKRSQRRAVDGILLLDKPPGMSSNGALQQVKRLFRARKAGHTGNLDPLATGMLPVCMGDATKVSAFLLDAEKRYRVTCTLGARTSTGDTEGEVVETGPVGPEVSERLDAVLACFRGEIRQVPPMYSAVKHRGERLYRLARQGIEVAREPRAVRIHALEVLERGAESFVLDLRCSKGTYVRTLVEDIAREMGSCGHVTSLRRLGVGPYQDQPMHTLEKLENLAVQGLSPLDALCLPIDSALCQWPAVDLTPDTAFYLRQGQPVLVPRLPQEGWVRLYESERRRFIGMGEIIEDGRVAPRRLMQGASA
ncbi:MAG TPA: tRNA pseudouridine(55) synthase TruB [Gammaproteobacteria bacterium]|nr:tRNA pseudouridine(55) synthase TruB [Gammaproteobacteria bacterium]